MKSLTSILTVLAAGTLFATAAEEKPGAKPEATATAAKPETAAAGAKPDKPKRDPAEVFKKLDSNSDGKLSAEEWKASPAGKKDAVKADEMFGKKDKDGDKSLTVEEFSAGGKKKNK